MFSTYERWMRTKRAGSRPVGEFGERLWLQVRLALAADAGVVVLRLDPVDALDRNDVHVRAVLHQQPLDEAPGRARRRRQRRTPRARRGPRGLAARDARAPARSASRSRSRPIGFIT